MITIITIADIIASPQASPFLGSTTGAYNGAGNFVGNGTSEGEAPFSMDFKGRSRNDGDFRGNADTNGIFCSYGYDSYPSCGMEPMAAPVAPVAPAE